jgi:CHAT domain-containing protein
MIKTPIFVLQVSKMGVFTFISLLGLASGSFDASAANHSAQAYGHANLHYHHLRFDSAAYCYQQAIPMLKADADTVAFGTALNNYAASLIWQSKFFEAEIACRENLETLIESFGYDHPLTADAMVNLGALGFASGSFGMTPEYLRQAISIYKKSFGSEHPKIATAYEWLGTWHEAGADTLNARKYLWKAFHLWSACRGVDHPDLGNIYRYMGLYHKRFQNHDSALICFKKAKELFDLKYGPANFQSVKCMNNLASIYAENPELVHLVMPLFDSCFRLMEHFLSPNIMTQVMTLFNKAAFFGSQGKYEQAIETMNEVLRVYFPHFAPEDIFSNPEISNSEMNQYIRYVFSYKAWYFEALFSESEKKNLKYLDAAISSLRYVEHEYSQMKGRIINLDDLLRMETSFAELFFGMAAIALQAYQLSNDTSYLTTAISFLNKDRTNTLFFAYEPGLQGTFILPPQFSVNRRELIRSVNEYRTRLAMLQPNESLSELNYLLQRDLIALDRLYYKYYKENQSPFEPSESNVPLYISDIQKQLKHNECLLLFAERKPLNLSVPQELIIFAINESMIRIEILRGEELFAELNNFCNSFDSRQTTLLSESKHRFYSVLLEPFEDILRQNLIIIPSPVISRLPFDLLTTGDNISGLPEYLISRYTIRKEFSLNTFHHSGNLKTGQTSPNVLAVAPVFNNNQVFHLAELTKRDTSLINLAGAMMECHNIAAYFDTRLLTGISATREKFLEYCRQYNIIHLSTHGIPMTNEPALMQLAFSSGLDKETENMLSFYEVLNLQLNTDLVVLSACKTGYGKINHGMGSLSLNWAFNRAGARSTVISLWDVNDYASALIMSAFYRNLSRGISKPEALRLAQLEYINTHDELMSDPYYWAGFVYYGPDEALVNAAGHSRTGIIILITGMFVTAAIALLYKRFSS